MDCRFALELVDYRQNERIRVKPIPMRTDVEYKTKIHIDEGPESLKERKQLEKKWVSAIDSVSAN